MTVILSSIALNIEIDMQNWNLIFHTSKHTVDCLHA